MEKTIEKLQPELVEKLRELKSKQSELLLNIGQIYLETKQLSKIQASLENEYDSVGSELQKELVDLENKYPNGEIDLGEGTIIY
jgi:Skp family chaperone for outer membrane proteins